MMTRKDFILIADVLAEAYRLAGPEQKKGVVITANLFAAILKTTNPRFQPERFLAAVYAAKKEERVS